MMALPIPSKTYWTLNREWYDWKGFYLYTQTLRLTAQYAEAERLERDRFEKGGKKISLLHATRGRPDQALAARDLWLSMASKPEQVEHIFATDGNDPTAGPLAGFSRVVISEEGGGCVAAWNEAARASQGEILIQMSDDWVPPRGWDETVIDRIGDTLNPSVLAISDGHRTDDLLCMAILTRRRLEDQGGFLFHPDFKSVFSDNYFTAMAQKDGVMIAARDVVFYHNHPAFTTAPGDKTYIETNSPARYNEGKEVFDRLMGQTK
jgi:hypothetical protein